MKRPVVLHCTHRWLQPSEGFVLDLVRSTTATRAVAVCRSSTEQLPDVGPPHVPLHDLDRLLRRLPWRLRDRSEPVLLGLTALRERADVLHAHFGYWAVPVATVARRLRLPWVLSLHGDDLLAHPDRDPAVLAAYCAADVVLVPSQWLADRAVERGIEPDRLRVVPSGVDLSRLPFRARTARPDGRVVVTFAGRFVEKKGLLDAVAALEIASAKIPGLHGVFVGHGPLEDELRSALAAATFSHEVRDGRVPRAVTTALQETDLALTASKVAPNGDAETLSLVNIEALAHGVPLVTTRTGGVPEHLPAHAPGHPAAAALLADEADPEGLAAHLVRLARDPGSWAARGAAGRAHVVKHLELGSRTADVEQVYASLVARRPAPHPVAERAELPSVSVVMVTHNRRALLAQALDALEAQVRPPLEVVVVDNGCTDGSSEDLLERPWVTVLRSETNSPPADARNRAAAVCRGAVIAFTDDDCRPVPTWTEALVAGMRQGVGVVQGRTIANPRLPLQPLSRTQWTPAEYGLYETANIAYDTAAFRSVGGFDEELAAQVARVLGPRFGRYPFGEDTDLAWRTRRTGVATRFAPHALVEHHVFPPDPRLLLRRAVLAAGFPLLVRETPELRRVFLSARFLLGWNRARFLLALLGLLLVPWCAWTLLLSLPYLWRVLRPHVRHGRRARLRAAPVIVLRDVVETVALVVGSVRARSIVL